MDFDRWYLGKTTEKEPQDQAGLYEVRDGMDYDEYMDYLLKDYRPGEIADE